jgi:hypothetical protein
MNSIDDYRNRRDNFDKMSPAEQLKTIGVHSASKNKFQILTESQDKSKKDSKTEEFNLRKKLCGWINDNYDGTLFVVDFAADLYLPIHIAKQRSDQSCIDKWLDLSIIEPRGGFFGLIIEIKTISHDVFLKDGSLSTAEHTQAQYHTIKKLCAHGYLALFGVGLDYCKSLITRYKDMPLTPANKIFTKHNQKLKF